MDTKEEHSQKIDDLIISLASGSSGSAELMRLVTTYAYEFRCPYKISAESMRSLATEAERERAEQLEVAVNQFIVAKLKDNKKLKQLHSRKIDDFINKCALGSECDESELVRLAIEHAQFRSPYKWSYGDLEPDEREVANQLEAKVNKVITRTIQREGPMGTMARVAMSRFSMQPTPNLRPIMPQCKCTGPNQSPKCRLQPGLCKTAAYSLSMTVPRTPNASSRASSPKPRASSPKTRKSNGGKRKSKSSNRRNRRS